MNDFSFFVKTSETARKGFEKQTPSGASFAAFRKFAKGINTSLVKDRKLYEQDTQEIRKKYLPRVADEKVAELKNAFMSTVSMKQDILRNICNRLISANENAIGQATITPPTDRQLRIIDSISRRDGNISDTEWNMVVSECSPNYQASAILNDFAEKHNKSYTLPFEPEKALQDLKILNEKLNKVIDHISEDPITAGNLDIAEFFAHDESRGQTYGVINILCEKFDTLAPAYVAESIVDLTDPAELTARLLEARGIAYRNNAKDLFNEIVRCDMRIRDNGLNEDNLKRAEELISIVHTLYPSNQGNPIKPDKAQVTAGKNVSDLLNPPKKGNNTTING